MLAEQLGELHRLRPEVRADALEDIVLRHFAAGRKRAAHLGHGFRLAAERDLGIEQRVARVPIGGSFVWESHAREVVRHD